MDARVDAIRGSVVDADSPEAPEVALVDTIDPFTTRPVPAVQAATAGPTGPTKKTWVVEILDADKLVAALVALPVNDLLQSALRVHEPTLRRLLANGLGTRQGRGGESRHAGQRAVRGSSGSQPKGHHERACVFSPAALLMWFKDPVRVLHSRATWNTRACVRRNRRGGGSPRVLDQENMAMSTRKPATTYVIFQR